MVEKHKSTKENWPNVLVCGSRELVDYPWVRNNLDRIFVERGWTTEPDDYGNYLLAGRIINGGAPGADTCATDFAVVNWMEFDEYPALWKVYGSKAGPLRNQLMLDCNVVDLVVAFPTAHSRGTWDMVRRAKLAGIETVVIFYDPKQNTANV